MNNDCAKMQDSIADYLLDNLSEQDSGALKEHVARCRNCAEYLQTLEEQKDLLREFAGKVNASMQPRKERMGEAIKNCDLSERGKLMSACWAVVCSRMTRLAVAAGLLVALGFIGGRLLPVRPIDAEQLRSALETSLKSSLDEAIHGSLIEQVKRDRESALEHHYVRLKSELARQSRHEMNELAKMTLCASQTATEERLAELIRLIEATRIVDRQQIARALEKIESNRLQDQTRFGESLVSLASLQDNRVLGDPEHN